MEILGETFDDPGPPAVLTLAGQNLLADPPIEKHQFLGDGGSSPDLGLADTLFQFTEERVVTFRDDRCCRLR